MFSVKPRFSQVLFERRIHSVTLFSIDCEAEIVVLSGYSKKKYSYFFLVHLNNNTHFKDATIQSIGKVSATTGAVRKALTSHSSFHQVK